MKKQDREELHQLLNRVVNRNGGIESLKKYYQEQGLTDEKLYQDLWKQVPPIDRQRLPLVTDKDIEQYFNQL